MLAAAARRRVHSQDAVMIDSNENPLGPGQAARMPFRRHSSRRAVPRQSHRRTWSTTLPNSKASTGPTHTSFLAPAPRFALPSLPHFAAEKKLCHCRSGYEAGSSRLRHGKPAWSKFRLRKLTRNDVKAMIAAAPDAGLFLHLQSNIPRARSRRIRSRVPCRKHTQGSIVMVDEAYLHFWRSTFDARLRQGGKRCGRAAHFFENLWHGRPALRISPLPAPI